MNQVVVQSTARDDFKLRLTIFAAVALLLGGDRHLRTDGVLRAQRTQKIGIRIARGASPRDMRNMVVSPGHATGVDRCGLGLAGAFGLTRLMASLLFGVKASDPVVFGLVAVLLSAVAFVPLTCPPAAPRVSIQWWPWVMSEASPGQRRHWAGT